MALPVPSSVIEMRLHTPRNRDVALFDGNLVSITAEREIQRRYEATGQVLLTEASREVLDRADALTRLVDLVVEFGGSFEISSDGVEWVICVEYGWEGREDPLAAVVYGIGASLDEALAETMESLL